MCFHLSEVLSHGIIMSPMGKKSSLQLFSTNNWVISSLVWVSYVIWYKLSLIIGIMQYRSEFSDHQLLSLQLVGNPYQGWRNRAIYVYHVPLTWSWTQWPQYHLPSHCCPPSTLCLGSAEPIHKYFPLMPEKSDNFPEALTSAWMRLGLLHAMISHLEFNDWHQWIFVNVPMCTFHLHQSCISEHCTARWSLSCNFNSLDKHVHTRCWVCSAPSLSLSTNFSWKHTDITQK